jgi:ankyrin repeat protein
VNILISEHESTRPVPSLAVAGPVKNIEERIKTIMKPGKKFYKHPSLIAATIVILIALLTVPTALVLTARAETKVPAEREDKPAKSLYQAAAEGDIEQVKSNLSQGADINGKDRGGRTALHRAAYEGRTDVVRLLIDRGADVNAKDGNQRTPLHSAAMHGDKKTVELLLSKGADINAKNKMGSTPLFVAMTSTRAGRKEVAELMVAKGAKIPAFHLAAYMGDIEELKKCLQDGIDINSQADVGSTALHLAANSGRKDIVEFLISKGAQVDAKDVFDWTPLLYAASHNYEDIADLLLAKGADVNAKDKWGYTLLYYAIGNEDKDMAKLLIAKGADVNAKDNMGYTPLYYAARYIDVAELLLTKGANVNASGGGLWGYTLLHWAAMNGHKDVAELLIAKGADMNAQNIIGVTPLHVAAGRGHTNIVELLLAKKADVNAKDNQGATPLWYAKNGVVFSFSTFGKFTKTATALWNAENPGCKEIVELLRKQGAKEEAPVLSLHEAAAVGNIEQVKSLISKGADVNAMDDRLDGTPLHLAAYWGQRQVVELLIANGTNVNAKNKWDRTPLHDAIDRGRTEIVELLRKHGAKVEISVGAAKKKPAKSLLESATSKFAIPKKNLEIPEHMQSCVANLRKIYAAIKKYEKDKGKLPYWLSDLVPEYVSKETLLCPPDPKHKARVFPDPKLPCNYNYEFKAARGAERFGGSPVDGMTTRDRKAAEMKLFGDVLPLVRCGRDGRWGMLLNISVGGQIYMSPLVWAKMFMPDYTVGLELSEESLR